MPDTDINVFVGVDMAKTEHFARAVTSDGDELVARSVTNDEATIDQMIDAAETHGQVAVVVDMTASGAQLYVGFVKTDPRDAWVLADYARRHTDQLGWLDVS